MSTSVGPTTRFRPRPDVLSRELEGEAVLLDLATGQYYSLNPTGRRIFELCNGEHTVPAIREILRREFDATEEELEADLMALLSELESRGLIASIE
jgi:hypothetical protein